MMYCNQMVYDGPAITIEPLTTEIIIKTVCYHFGITEIEIKGICRKRKYSDPRAIAAQIIRSRMPGITFKNMGKIFNNRHYSTMIYAIDRFNDMYLTDRNYKADYKAILTIVDKLEKQPENVDNLPLIIN